MHSDLIGDIYANMAQPGKLATVLEQVGRHVGADSAFLFTSHSATEPEAILLAHNICPDAIARFVDYWHQEDIWAHAAARRGLMKRDVVLIGEELVSEEALCRSAYYNDFAGAGGMHHMLGSVLFDGGVGQHHIPFTNLCWYRAAGRPSFGTAEKHLLTKLLPHLQGGLALQYQMHRAALDNLVVQQLDSALPVASLLLDERLRIVRRNSLGDRLLRGAVPLVSSCNERVIHVGQRSSPTIQEAVAACRQTRRAVGMVVQRADGTLIRSTVAPLPANTVTLAGAMDQPCCLLLIELPRDNSAELVRHACTLLGFTTAEGEVALGLLKGKTIQQIAADRAIALSTARTQLRGVLEKSGFQRQVDLVQALTRLGA